LAAVATVGAEVPAVSSLPLTRSSTLTTWGPPRSWPESFLERLLDIWRYRDLLFNFVARDVRLRYQGSALGFLWSLLNPLLMTGIFTLLFMVFMENRGIPRFPVFALLGILAWNFHSVTITAGIQSITGNGALISKARFPRELIPLSVVLANAVNFLLALPLVLVLVLVSGVPVGWSLLFFPVALALQVTFLLGFAFFFSTLNVFYRDTGIIMDSLLLAWFFLTPIFYQPQELFPEWQRLLYIVNPVASVVAIYRDVLYAGGWPDPAFVLRTIIQAVAVLVVGWVVFERFSDRFVEEL
jgi:ABC-type polysaccharide/polyol phosphate export permease